ncbi:hypothetical protein IP91_04351 [Pseudoduganella lurida]|uniref:Uncharacterized protein n=1 Tax=Pseudoduganella lurida TaxID=1036180 RepID=A0A562QZL1_9BURK|nr:hypothetical protein [Pseudoduganella lurida]TWI62242.1 hypothetical protein IP91_04351 [Pseudoduganella lurida]
MEKLTGTVTELRRGKTVSYNPKTGTSTVHAAVFRLDGRLVKIVSTDPVVIAEGHEMLVAGRQRGKVFAAQAHRNLSTRVEGHEGWATRLCVTIAVLTVALWLAAQIGGAYLPVFALVFLAAGVAMAWRSFEVMQAIAALRPARKTSGRRA